MDNSSHDKNKEQANLQRTIHELELKIAKLQKERAVFAVKSRLLGDELSHYRAREGREYTLVDELLERQRELNVMLNRSNIMLARAQDATAMLSLEFGELARSLPESVTLEVDGHIDTVKVDDRVDRINELFKKSGQIAEELKEQLHTNAEAQARAGHIPRGGDPFAAQTRRVTPPIPPAEPTEAPTTPPTGEATASNATIHVSEPSTEPVADAAEPVQENASVAQTAFKNWATHQKTNSASTVANAGAEAMVTEQEQADIEAALADQGGFWSRLKNKISG